MKTTLEADSEVICMQFIRWCENSGRLNSECGLSTIEYVRSRDPAKALEYVNEVRARYGEPAWVLKNQKGPVVMTDPFDTNLMTEAQAIASALFQKQLIRPEADIDEVTAVVKAAQDKEPPHYVIYYMGIEEIGSTLYDSHDACVEDCETEMIPVPVYGIPWPDPEDGEEEENDNKAS